MGCLSAYAGPQGDFSLAYPFLALVPSALPGSGGVMGNFLWPLFTSLLGPILMSVLLTKTLLLYPAVFLMFMFKLLGSM